MEMKKAIVEYQYLKNKTRVPYFVFIFDDGQVRVVGDESRMTGKKARDMKNDFAAMSVNEKIDQAKLIFDEFTGSSPTFSYVYDMFDYDGENKKMIDDMFDEISARNFDLAKEKKDG